MSIAMDPAASMPLTEHLRDLRKRLVRCLALVALVFAGLFPFAQTLYTLISEPLRRFLPEGASMIATSVTSPFLTPFKLTAMCAVFVAMPLLLHQARYRDGALLVEGPGHLFFERAHVDHGHVGIRIGNRARDEWLQRARRHGGNQQNATNVVRGCLHALHQRARVLHGLRQRHEEHRTRRFIELKAREPGVTDNAHNTKRVDVLGQVHAKVPVERILTRREESAHECFVHHRHIL